MKKLLRSPIALFFLALVAVAAGIATYRQLYMAAPELQYQLQAVEKGDIAQTVSASGTINRSRLR